MPKPFMAIDSMTGTPKNRDRPAESIHMPFLADDPDTITQQENRCSKDKDTRENTDDIFSIAVAIRVLFIGRSCCYFQADEHGNAGNHVMK